MLEINLSGFTSDSLTSLFGATEPTAASTFSLALFDGIGDRAGHVLVAHADPSIPVAVLVACALVASLRLVVNHEAGGHLLVHTASATKPAAFVGSSA